MNNTEHQQIITTRQRQTQTKGKIVNATQEQQNINPKTTTRKTATKTTQLFCLPTTQKKQKQHRKNAQHQIYTLNTRKHPQNTNAQSKNTQQ